MALRSLISAVRMTCKLVKPVNNNVLSLVKANTSLIKSEPQAESTVISNESSPVNTLVLGPGQYRFADFVKIGVPFTVLVMLVTVLMVPWFFGLQ